MKSFSTIFFLSLFLFSCASSKNVVEVPTWISERPITQSYYVGIASASKYEYPYNAIEIAKENALNSLAREIRVNVSSSSLLSTLQVNHWVEESFESNIQSTVAEDLEGYTLVGTYEDKNEAWVYYQLNKAEYARILENRKRAALGIAYGHYLDAERMVSSGEIPLAIERYLLGLDAMNHYLGELNPYTGDDGVEFQLDRALLNGITESISKLKVTTFINSVELTLEDNYTDQITIGVTYEGEPVAGVPLTYTYARGNISTKTYGIEGVGSVSYSKGSVPFNGRAITTHDGSATLQLQGFDAGTRYSELEVYVDVSDLASILQPLSPLKPLVENINSTPLILPINLEVPKVVVTGREKMYGNSSRSKILIPAVKEALIEKGIEVVSRDTPGALTLKVNADTQLGGGGHGFTTAYLTATIVLKDMEGNTVMQKNFDRVKGIQSGKEQAANEAYRKAAKKVNGRFISQFVDALYK